MARAVEEVQNMLQGAAAVDVVVESVAVVVNLAIHGMIVAVHGVAVVFGSPRKQKEMSWLGTLEK